MLKPIAALASVVFMFFAAFKVDWGTDTVNWFYMSWACALLVLLLFVPREWGRL